MRGLVPIVLLMLCFPVHAGTRADVCFNYGCTARASVAFGAQDLGSIRTRFARVEDAAGERDAIAEAVGALYRVAGRQAPISADRAGNLLDNGVHGRMDCIDHSTTTTGLLNLMASQGWLRFHEVRDPARRTRLIFQHFSAVIEEVARPGETAGEVRFAVDSWFVDHGEPAVILPLADWLKGEGPNVQ